MSPSANIRAQRDVKNLSYALLAQPGQKPPPVFPVRSIRWRGEHGDRHTGAKIGQKPLRIIEVIPGIVLACVDASAADNAKVIIHPNSYFIPVAICDVRALHRTKTNASVATNACRDIVCN